MCGRGNEFQKNFVHMSLYSMIDTLFMSNVMYQTVKFLSPLLEYYSNIVIVYTVASIRRLPRNRRRVIIQLIYARYYLNNNYQRAV